MSGPAQCCARAWADACMVPQAARHRVWPPPLFHACLSPLRAVGCVVLTMDAVEARRAGARVAVHAVSAVGAIAAGAAGTLVDVLLTEGALEAGQAAAEGCVDTICAGAPIVTRIWWEQEGQPEGGHCPRCRDKCTGGTALQEAWEPFTAIGAGSVFHMLFLGPRPGRRGF